MNLFATIVLLSAVIAATVAVPVNVPSSSSKDIQDEIEFLRHHTTNLPISLPLYPDRNAETAAKLRCIISAIDKVNETQNLGDDWVETRAELVSTADNLEQCKDDLCSLVYYFRAVYVLVVYMDEVEKQNPEAYEAIQKQINEQCSKSDEPKISVVDAVAAEKFRCIISAIDKVDKTHKLGERWAQTKRELAPIVDAMEKCTDKECTDNHVISAAFVLAIYLEEVKNNNPEAYKAIEKQAKEQCER